MQAVIFGAGAVGLGFLGELLGKSGWQITFADIDSALVAALNAQGRYLFSKVSDRIGPVEVEGVAAIDLGAATAQDQVAAKLREADLIFTAAGARAFPAVGQALARAAQAVTAGRPPLNVLCCENHRDAALALTEATQAALDRPELLPEKYAFVNTVIARMCQRLSPEETEHPPVTPGSHVVIFTEAYQLLPADGSQVAPPMREFEGLRVLSGPEFVAWDHRKLFAHNGTHALLGVLGKLAGHSYMYECALDSDIDAAARRALWEEVGRALLAAHPQVFTRADHEAFAEDLYARITSRLFADGVDRGTRDALRMISPADGRLSGAAELVLKHGGEPRALALAIAGVLRLNGCSVGETAALLAHVDPAVRPQLVELSQRAYQCLATWQEGSRGALRAFLA